MVFSQDLVQARTLMVEQQLRARGIRDERVLAAFLRVPRHLFVPPELQHEAYEDRPLPIGEGQTISQPYIVAIMLQLAEVHDSDRVLEIGTGSGYLTALLCELAARVYSIERVAKLAEHARDVLARLGCHNAWIAIGDGSEGLPQYAPYDVIIASAAAPSIPRSLAAQLAEGGRMVLPVGDVADQALVVVRKRGGELTMERREGCRFVPLIGREGFHA